MKTFKKYKNFYNNVYVLLVVTCLNYLCYINYYYFQNILIKKIALVTKKLKVMGFTYEYLELIRWSWSNISVTLFLEMLLNESQRHCGQWRNAHGQRNLNFEQGLEGILLANIILYLLNDVTDDLRSPLLSGTL